MKPEAHSNLTLSFPQEPLFTIHKFSAGSDLIVYYCLNSEKICIFTYF
jgi:hypothetical protein